MASPYLPTEQAVAQSSPEVLGIERQRKLADLLTAQATQQPQGQMISGHYVAPSWTQQLNPMANILAGNAISERADKQQTELANALRVKQNEVVNAFTEAKTPKEKFAAATNEYAPAWLKSVGAKMLETQKAGKGDVISQLDLSTGQMQPILEGKPDLPSSVEEYLYAQKDPNYVPYQQMMNKSKANNISVNTGQHGFDNALKLRSDFRSEPVYKGFEEVKSAYNQINQAAKMASPAGDLAAATKVMKILDPGSVVRESELGMAIAATGVEDRVRNYATMVINGTKLTPDQRKDFVDLSEKLYNVSAEQYNSKRKEYEDIAKANELSVPAAAGNPAEIKQTGWRLK